MLDLTEVPTFTITSLFGREMIDTATVKVFLIDGSHKGETIEVPADASGWQLPVHDDVTIGSNALIELKTELYRFMTANMLGKVIRIGYVSYDEREQNAFDSMITEGARSAIIEEEDVSKEEHKA